MSQRLPPPGPFSEKDGAGNPTSGYKPTAPPLPVGGKGSEDRQGDKPAPETK